MSHITNEPINLITELSKAHSDKTGAVVLFSGEVRASNKGKTVLWLEYEAYNSMAEEVIQKILATAIEKWQLHYAYCVHRVGKLNISECAVLIITGAAHRDAAYQANRYIIDEVKSKAPIWKNEFFSDGSNEWGTNDCLCNHKH